MNTPVRRKYRFFFFLLSVTTISMFMIAEVREISRNYVQIMISYTSELYENATVTEPCACESCISQLTNEWFLLRYKPNIHPIWSKNNSQLNGTVYRWWQRLQPSRQRRHYTKVLETLFELIPGEGHYMDAGPDRCRSCSVVGNSGNLVGSHYGPLIDASDFVLRMNRAPIQGFEGDVGKRTTHRIVYPESAVHPENDTNLVLMPFKTLDLEWLVSALTHGGMKRTRQPVLSKLTIDSDQVMVISPAFMKYVHHDWLKGKGNYPSTGFLTLIFALHICDEVNVFGFGANSRGTWHHYYEPTPKNFRLTGQHSGSYEKNVTAELVNRSIIQLFSGW